MQKIIKNNKQSFDFDEKWVEILLTKNALSRKDMVALIHKFNLNFTEKNWEKRLSIKEMGIVLTLEIEKNEIIPILEKIIFEKYPYLLTYTEAKNILNFFNSLSENILYKLYISLCSNKKNINFLAYDKNKKDFTKEDLLFLLIKEIYGVGDNI